MEFQCTVFDNVVLIKIDRVMKLDSYVPIDNTTVQWL